MLISAIKHQRVGTVKMILEKEICPSEVMVQHCRSALTVTTRTGDATMIDLLENAVESHTTMAGESYLNMK